MVNLVAVNTSCFSSVKVLKKPPVFSAFVCLHVCKMLQMEAEQVDEYEQD